MAGLISKFSQLNAWSKPALASMDRSHEKQYRRRRGYLLLDHFDHAETLSANQLMLRAYDTLLEVVQKRYIPERERERERELAVVEREREKNKYENELWENKNMKWDYI